MGKLKSILLLALCMSCFFSFAQKKRESLTQRYGKVNKPLKFKMNKKMAVICPIFHPSEYPYQGIGFRAGDPFTITYKLFATKWLAFSIDGGIAAFGLYKDRYKELYQNSPEADTLIYLNHQVLKDVVFTGKISFYQEGPDFMKGLDIYAGIGWQMRFAEILYGYNKDIGSGINEFGSTTKQFDYAGPEFHLGLEYAYFDLPISAFLEGNVFYDLTFEPTFIKLQFGIGVRYVF